MSISTETELRAPPRSVFSSRELVPLAHDSILLFGEGEERSQLPQLWKDHFQGARLIQVREASEFGQVLLDIEAGRVFSLREGRQIKLLLSQLPLGTVYLDITGLSHHIWIPLMRFLLELNREVKVLYSEPGTYQANPNPRPGEFYQLSERFRDFQPIPTFARLRSRGASLSILIPLLGFEGVRFRRLVEIEEPDDGDIWPIVGIPGFEIDYPFHTFEGNADVLKKTRSYQRVDFSDAACPFSLYRRLEILRSDWPGHLMKLALIGTKPHALGAVLFALVDSSVELLHDHPIRKSGRTQGAGRCHLYCISTFMQMGQ